MTKGWLGLTAIGALLLCAGLVTTAARTGEGESRVAIVPLAEPPSPSADVTTAAAVPEPSPPPPAPSPVPRPPRSLLAEHQIVAYYGNPWSPIMGVLGEYEGEELVGRLQAQAARYQALNPEQAVKAALHLVYAVAQADAGPDGSFIVHMPDEMVEGLIELTRRHDMLFFIDLQMGRADPVAETRRVLPWLRHEHVHLAVDPEFTMKPGERPGLDLGAMDSAMINQIQDLLQELVHETDGANKILIVHQFQADMIVDKAAIADRDRVDVVIDLDGWGPPWSKLEKYEALARNEPVEHAGFKLFYRWDAPLMSEAEVQALVPRPSVVVYQ